MLQKERLLLTRVVALTAALIITTCAAAISAPTRTAQPYGGGILSVGAGANSSDFVHRYIGLQRPDLFYRLRTKQGSGPNPDINLTPTATASQELYANSASYGELNRIVISSNGVDDDGNGQFDVGGITLDGTSNLWQLRVDGSFVRQLTDMPGDEIQPDYSPGGRLVAFSNNSSGIWQIYTVEVLTGTVTQITTSPGNKWHPTWSPDSNQFVFSGDASGNLDLYVMPANGSLAPTRITTNPSDETEPMWAPSAAVATPILFVREVGTGSQVLAVDPTGGNETQLTNGGGDPQAQDRDPAWRHTAQMIAFSSTRLGGMGDSMRDYNIFTMGAGGELTIPATPRTKLDPNDWTQLDPTDAYDDRYPAFNPGLNPREPVRIFFTSDRPDTAGAEDDIWRLEVSDPVPPELVGLPRIENVPNTAVSRYLPAGSDVVVSVEVYDRDTGVAAVSAEFKDPDSAPDDSQGIDHKQFIYLATDLATDRTSGIAAMEVDCDTVGQVPMLDDGTNGDAVAGDGVFTGTWTTPGSPSDFIIDIHVQDNAGNAFEYDDVYGFTTQLFEPKTNALLVDDYCEGQGFIFAASGANNDLPTAYPVESYYTSNPGGAGTNEAINTFLDGVDGAGYLGEDYDMWRVICRGPIQITDLIYYLPTKEVQLTVPDLLGTREVLVADRAVVWAAPHSGDTWVAPGSLVDASAQATLSTFLDRGGRLMISGQNIGFALTLNGTVQNNFFSNYLHSTYVADSAGGVCTAVTGGGHPETRGIAGDPVAQEPFGHYQDDPLNTVLGWFVFTNTCYAQDSALWSEWADVIQATSDAIVTHEYSTTTAGIAGLRYEQPGGGYRVVYFAWGFEQSHRMWYPTTPNEWGPCKNHRSKMLHNVLCWLRTGGFQGRVLSISDGNQPINDPTPIVQVRRGNTIIGAVQCEEDGRYVMGGIPPGVYGISAYRPGFEIDHAEAVSTHGGLNYPVQDFAITRAQPGAIRGTVTSAATGEPLATVQVCVYELPLPVDLDGDGVPDPPDPDAVGPVISCTTTAADGTYMIGDIPPGDVIVIADGSGIGYGSERADVTVTTGNTLTVDFALQAAPGVVVATVTDDQANPLENALVQVLDGITVVASGYTDQAGQVSLDVQPGDYTVAAEASGYERSAPQPVSVDAGQQVDVTIALQSQPPGALSGTITRAVSGEPVGGVTVDLIVGQQVVATATSAATITDPGGGAAPYNYRFANAPTGQVTVRPNPIGFSSNPPERLETVVSGEETDGVNFSLSSIRTFPAGLQLISLPWDYPLTDPATLLGLQPGQLQMASYEPTDGSYHIYPSAPADRFRLGYGYWLNLTQVRELSQEGTEATDVYSVALRRGRDGWNLLGTFFRQPIDFYALTVQDNGVIRTMQQAMAAGLVRSSLYAYVVGGYQTTAVMEPFVGYWINVGDDINIIGDRSVATLAAGQGSSRPAVIAPEDGWLLPLVVSADGMQDASTWVGCAASASDGYDAGVDMPKPPPPGMGPSVWAAVRHSDWGDDSGAYAMDVRSAATAGTKWTVSVSTTQVEGKVAVRWPDLSGVPANVRPVITDPVTGRRIYMRTAQGYEFTLREGSRDLEIELLPSAGTLTVGGLNTAAAGGAVTVSYVLSAAAQVDVSVINISGRVVQQLSAGEMQTAGRQQVLWNGRTRSGTLVPAGMYFVVVKARSDDGREAQAIGSLRLAR